MGQKTHPIGLRLGIIKAIKSHWYIKKKVEYAFFMTEDQKLRDSIRQIFRSSTVSAIEIDRRNFGVRLRISAARIKAIVGVDNKRLKELHLGIKEECQRIRKEYFQYFGFLFYRSLINQQYFWFVCKPEVQMFLRKVPNPKEDAQCLVAYMVIELKQRTAFRRVLRMAKRRARPKVGGIRLQIAGRLNGAEIARTQWLLQGRLPLHILSRDFDYAFKTARTMYGLLGVKVWIYV